MIGKLLLTTHLCGIGSQDLVTFNMFGCIM